MPLKSSASSSRFARHSLFFTDIFSRSAFFFSRLFESLVTSCFVSSITFNTSSISCSLPDTSLPILPLFTTASLIPFSSSFISCVIRFIFSEIKLALFPSEVISTINPEFSLEMPFSVLCSSSSCVFKEAIFSSYNLFLLLLSDNFKLAMSSSFLRLLFFCSVSLASRWICISFSSFALKSLNALS